MDTTQTIHPVYTSGPDETPLYYIIPKDGSTGYCLGEMWEIRDLLARITALVEHGQHDGILDDTDPQIHEHITATEAAGLAGLTPRAIRAACDRGDIHGAIKDGAHWSLPTRHFRHWLRNKRKHKRGPSPAAR